MIIQETPHTSTKETAQASTQETPQTYAQTSVQASAQNTPQETLTSAQSTLQVRKKSSNN